VYDEVVKEVDTPFEVRMTEFITESGSKLLVNPTIEHAGGDGQKRGLSKS